jgi:hypothetical protein
VTWQTFCKSQFVSFIAGQDLTGNGDMDYDEKIGAGVVISTTALETLVT